MAVSVSPVMAAMMPTRLRASGRLSSRLGSAGSGSGAVRALRILEAISSSVSMRLTRLMSEGSDLLILALPSRRDMTRAAVPPPLKGSGRTEVRAPRSGRRRPRPRGPAADKGLGQDEGLDARVEVELGCDVPGEFDMLLLVLAD